MKLGSLILLFGLMNTPQGYNDRRIIVVAASENNSEVENQVDWLKKNSDELEDRRLAVFTLIEDEVKAEINPSEQSEKFVKENKADLKTTSATPQIYLIGLDKSVKKTFTKFVQPQDIFEIVDQMPIRQAEMRKN